MICHQSAGRKRPSGVSGVALRRLHPGIRRQDPECADQRADRHQHRRDEIDAAPDALAAEQHDAEEAGFQEEGRHHLVAHQRPDHRAGLVGEARPVGAELVRHHHAGDDAHAEHDGECLQPVLEDVEIDLPARWQATAPPAPRDSWPARCVKAGSTMWKPTVKANCARASRTASAPGMPTSRACRRASVWQSGSAKRAVQAAWRIASGRTWVSAAHADHLAQIALDQMHRVGRASPPWRSRHAWSRQNGATTCGRGSGRAWRMAAGGGTAGQALHPHRA